MNNGFLSSKKEGLYLFYQLILSKKTLNLKLYYNLEKIRNSNLIEDLEKMYDLPIIVLFGSQLLPHLEKLEGMKKEEINASIYKGKEGLKTIHAEMLREGTDVLMIGAKGIIFDELPYFMPHFEKERIKKKLKFIGLWDKKEVRDKLANKPLIEGKALPSGFDSNTVVNIFGNKVAIVLWKEKNPTGFMIENKDVADSFRKWFQLISKVCR